MSKICFMYGMLALLCQELTHFGNQNLSAMSKKLLKKVPSTSITSTTGTKSASSMTGVEIWSGCGRRKKASALNLTQFSWGSF